jgi:hypothetical protein
MSKKFSDNGGDSLRNRIFYVLRHNNASDEKAFKALSQCAEYIHNRTIVEAIAKECGLKLSRFITNNDLELYYDIKRGRHDMGYISKGWEDPGFRIGDVLIVPKRKIGSLKAGIYELLKFCATNGIALSIEEGRETVEIQMDAVIYSEGFNKHTFMDTLETLNECIEKAESLLSG